MHANAPHWMCYAASRALALLLLLVLVLTPACSSICQAHHCTESTQTKEHATCHHESDGTPDNSLTTLRAITASCHAPEQLCGAAGHSLLALPEIFDNLETQKSQPNVLDAHASSDAIVVDISAHDQRLKLNSRSVREFHRSIASQFSFESFVFLRV